MENYPKSFVLCSNEFGIGYLSERSIGTVVFIFTEYLK